MLFVSMTNSFYIVLFSFNNKSTIGGKQERMNQKGEEKIISTKEEKQVRPPMPNCIIETVRRKKGKNWENDPVIQNILSMKSTKRFT